MLPRIFLFISPLGLRILVPNFLVSFSLTSFFLSIFHPILSASIVVAPHDLNIFATSVFPAPACPAIPIRIFEF